jgi:hypothetical protein
VGWRNDGRKAGQSAPTHCRSRRCCHCCHCGAVFCLVDAVDAVDVVVSVGNKGRPRNRNASPGLGTQTGCLGVSCSGLVDLLIVTSLTRMKPLVVGSHRIGWLRNHLVRRSQSVCLSISLTDHSLPPALSHSASRAVEFRLLISSTPGGDGIRPVTGVLRVRKRCHNPNSQSSISDAVSRPSGKQINAGPPRHRPTCRRGTM